jgi:hypothetical protein
MGSFSGSYSKSRNKTNSSTSVWGDQSPFLMDLYRRGAELVGQYDPEPNMQALQGHINPQMNPYLGQMTQQYTQALGQLDNATGGAAAAQGVFGGGRQGVEQHLNQQNIGNQVGNFLGNQYQADQARSMTALSMAPQVQFGGLQGYAGLLGSPTVLAQSKGRGIARSGSTSGSVMSK